MAFEPDVIKQVVNVAKRNGVDPSGLLAVVEVESDGKSMEVDGKTPCLLFERHIFYRELKKRQPGKLQAAIDAGLAHQDWRRATQYRDQGTSTKRLALIERARAIDTECANRSASWGVGQTMGFLAEELKFPNANAMLKFMMDGGIPAQVECMLREIKNKNLIPSLNNHDWAHFARIYNGSGYAANQYDTRMAAAERKWRNKIADEPDLPDANEPIDPPKTRVPDAIPDASTLPKSKTVWGGILTWLGGIAGTIGGMFQYLATPWGFATFALIVVVASVGLYLVIKGRIDIGNLVARLKDET